MKTEKLEFEIPIIPRIYSAKPVAEVMLYDGKLWRRKVARPGYTPHEWELCDEQTEDAVIEGLASETTNSRIRFYQAMLHAVRQTPDSLYLSKTALVRSRQQIDDCIEFIRERMGKEVELLPRSE